MRWKSINPPPCSRSTMPPTADRPRPSGQAFPVFGDIPDSPHVLLLPNALSITSGSRGSTVRSIRGISALTTSAFTADDERADTGHGRDAREASRTVAHHRRPWNRIPARASPCRPALAENPFDGPCVRPCARRDGRNANRWPRLLSGEEKRNALPAEVTSSLTGCMASKPIHAFRRPVRGFHVNVREPVFGPARP